MRAAGRLHRSRGRCCSAALTVDWFYSPRFKPALLSSRRQPPRGKPTLLRPLRLPSAGLKPAPRAGRWGALPPGAGRALWRGGYLERGVGLKRVPGTGKRPLLGIGRAAPGGWAESSGHTECPPVSWVLGVQVVGVPQPESEAATGTDSIRSSPDLGRAALVPKCSWQRGERGPGARERRRFGSNPGCRMVRTPQGAGPARLQSSALREGSHGRAVCGTRAARGPDRAPSDHGEEWS